MQKVRHIRDIERRLEVIEETLADAASGNLLARIPLDPQYSDGLTPIEIGINLILSDLEQETSDRLTLVEMLAEREGKDKG